MAISFPNHHLEDPLSHPSFLSLLRKTAGDSLTRAANSEQQEPQLVHEFLKPVTQALSNSEKFLEQAKMILDSNSDPPKSDLLHQALSQDGDITSAVNATDHPQRRRLDMGGRKRSQFSLWPSISQSSSKVDTTSNILQLKDPEEFFLAFERSEKADRLLKKLRGEDATNLTQYHQPAKTRTRRLGISGKKYSYKHPTLPDISEKHSLSKEENLEANGNFVSSQTENFSPADVMFQTGVNNHIQEAPDTPDTSQEIETSDSEICDVTQQKDSVAMLENSVGKLLATLMSSCEDLDGGGTVSLLQEHLGVKPIDLPKLSLPSLTASTSCFSPLEKLSSRRAEEVPATALSALRKLVSTSNGKTPVKHQQEPENFSSPHTSPLPPTLLASISRLLKYHAKIDTQKSPSLDPQKENESSVKHSYSVGGTGITAISSQVDISQLSTSSLNFGQYFGAANVDEISTSNCKTPIKFSKDSVNSSCPRTSPTPPRSMTALLPILQKHDPQFNNRSPEKHSLSVGHMRKQGMPLPADANKDDMGSLRFSLDPSSANIDGRRLSFEGDAQSLEGNNSTLFNNSNSPKVLKDHSSCPFDGTTTGDINRSSGDMDFRPDVHESKADEVQIAPCKTTISQGEVPGFGSPTSKTIHDTRNLLPDQSGPTTDSCFMVDGHSENLSIPTELNNAEYQAHKVPKKRRNKRKAFQHKKSLAAAIADSSFPVDGHSENLSVLAELNNKENQATKISSQRRNKRKSVQVREILGARSSPTADSCLPVDGPAENLNISTEFNIEENWAPEVSRKKRNRRKAVQRRDSLAARSSPTADSCFPVDGPSENLNISTEFNIEENWAPKVSPKKRNKRKAVQRRDSLAARSSPTADSCLPVDGPSENLNISTKINIEENWVPKVSPKKRNRRKAVQRRDSLAGAGTVWKSGVRRSTRIRTRPLEEWRGERFLYARIHDSLTTVIGLKYASPAKDGSDKTPVFKVKSFVSEEYAELVRKAAL